MDFHAVGHSTRALEELVGIVDAAGAWPLVDVRSLPGSRRCPQFNKENLEAELGPRYVHIPDLGGRRRARAGCCDLDNGGWRVASFRHYADYMATPEFERGLAELEAIGRGTVMCSEAVWWRCHRRMVSDALVARGHTVTHLGVGRRPSRHELTDFAATEPRLHYPENATIRMEEVAP